MNVFEINGQPENDVASFLRTIEMEKYTFKS